MENPRMSKSLIIEKYEIPGSNRRVARIHNAVKHLSAIKTINRKMMRSKQTRYNNKKSSKIQKKENFSVILSFHQFHLEFRPWLLWIHL